MTERKNGFGRLWDWLVDRPDGAPDGKWPECERRQRTRIYALAAVVVACTLGFAWRAALLGAPWGVPDSHPWYDAEDLTEYWGVIGSSGRLQYASTQVSLDLLFPLAYAGLLTLLANCVWRSRCSNRDRCPGGGLWVAPFLAASCDIAENLLLAAFALAYPASPPHFLVGLASVLTFAKFSFFGVSILVLGGVLGATQPRAVRLLGLPWLAAVAWMLTQWPAPGVVSLFLLAVVVHRHWAHVFQYLFFLRFILLVSIGLVLFPTVARSAADGFLFRNLFDMGSWQGAAPSWLSAFLVSFCLGMLSTTLMWTARLVVLTVPERYVLPLPRGQQGGFAAQTRAFVLHLAPDLVRLAPVAFAALALPSLVEIWQLTGQRGLQRQAALVVALAAGPACWIALAYLVRWQRLSEVWYRLAQRAGRLRWAQHPWVQGLQRADSHPLLGFGGQGHAPMLLFVLAVAACYFLGWLLLDPATRFSDSLPALTFVLLVPVVVAWSMSILAVIVDVWRVPVWLVVLVALVASHQATSYDHYFDVAARPDPAMRLPTPRESFDAWRSRNPSPSFVTVVAASGGGIKASLWTAVVLRELVAKSLGPSILLLSTNSGGSVGGMYFTDAFVGAPPDAAMLERVVHAAGSSSLTACTWSMAYRDLWHFVGGGLVGLGPRTHDRGWAMDRRWESRRAALSPTPSNPHPATLGEWAQDVRAGRRPAHVFNATAVDSGAAFRLASVDLGSSRDPAAHGSHPQEFWDYYDAAKADVDVATAARLSASFPWVSPMARAWASPSLQGKVDIALMNSPRAIRLADGGYFDNFGVFSALEFLRDIGADHLSRSGIHHVLFVQIRATPEGDAVPQRGGLQYSLAGPIIAMNSVRNSSQIARNDVELTHVEELWRCSSPRVEIVRLTFDLLSPGPLSWQLTQDEGDGVVAGWSQVHKDYLDRIARILTGNESWTDGGSAGAHLH